MSESPESTQQTGKKPWKSILSVLAVTKFSDWLASKAAPADQPDGTTARPTLTARVLQAVTQAGGTAAVTAVLSQARNRNRRLAAIRTALSPPGQVPPSAESEATQKTGTAATASPKLDAPAMPGASAAARPDGAMQSATQTVNGLMDSLQSVSSPDQISDARNQITSAIEALEEIQNAPVASSAAEPPQPVQSPPAKPVTPAARPPLPASQSAARIGRVDSAMARAKAFVSGSPLMTAGDSASLLKLTPDEFGQLHSQGRIAGHVADSKRGPLFESGFMRSSAGSRSRVIRDTELPAPLTGLSSEFETAESAGISTARLQAMRESGQVTPQLDESFGIRRYQYSAEDRQALEQLAPPVTKQTVVPLPPPVTASLPAAETGSMPGGRSETKEPQPLPSRQVSQVSRSQAAPVSDSIGSQEPGEHLDLRPQQSRAIAAISEQTQGSLSHSELDSHTSPQVASSRSRGRLSRAWQGVKSKASAWANSVTSLPQSSSVVAQSGFASRKSAAGNVASVVADQVRNSGTVLQESGPLPKAMAAVGKVASKWLGPVASAAAGIPLPDTANSGRASAASVPPTASAGSVPSDGSRDTDSGVRPSGSGGSDDPPKYPPIYEDPEDDDEPERQRKSSRRKKSPQKKEAARKKRSWLTEDNIMMLPRGLHRPLRQLRRLPKPSRRTQVIGRRMARQAMGRMAGTRLGGAALQVAGRVAPMAGRVVAGAMGSTAGKAAIGMAGTAGMIAGGAALGAGLTGLAVLLAGTVTMALKGFVARIAESNRGLAQFNGHIGLAFARSDFNEIRRNVKKGRNTAASATYAVEQSDRLEEALLPLVTSITNLYNNTAGLLGSAVAATFEAGNGAVDGVKERWQADIDGLAQIMMRIAGMTEEQIADEQEHLEELRRIAANTARDQASPPIGAMFLNQLENTAPAPPAGPMPPLWDDIP